MSYDPFEDMKWEEPDEAVVKELVQLGCFAADLAYLDELPTTKAEATRIVVKAAIVSLLANGLIQARLPKDGEVIFIPRPPQ